MASIIWSPWIAERKFPAGFCSHIRVRRGEQSDYYGLWEPRCIKQASNFLERLSLEKRRGFETQVSLKGRMGSCWKDVLSQLTRCSSFQRMLLHLPCLHVFGGSLTQLLAGTPKLSRERNLHRGKNDVMLCCLLGKKKKKKQPIEFAISELKSKQHKWS